jgi:hypothetical protein
LAAAGPPWAKVRLPKSWTNRSRHTAST